MTDDLGAMIGHARREVADRVEALAPERWDSGSWCRGWRVRDVLGHLVWLAEASPLAVWVGVPVRGRGRADAELDRIARRVGDTAVPELADRLRGAPASRPTRRALGDVLVHAADALRPSGAEFEVPPRDVLPVLDVYRGLFGRLAFHARPAQGRRLVATDADWAAGRGPEVRGRAVDLLLLLANRRQVLPLLEGPGTAGL